MAFWIQDIKNRARHHRADGRARHDPGLRVSDRVLALNYGRVLAIGHAGARCRRHPEVIAAYLGG